MRKPIKGNKWTVSYMACETITHQSNLSCQSKTGILQVSI